jgi:hypothetical protein
MCGLALWCLVPAWRVAAGDTTTLLYAAIQTRIAVSTMAREGTTIPAAHCRHAKEGCDRRLAEFAEYLTDAAAEFSVDPWLPAAMAARESGFNPFAQGSMGELGLFQIHPRSRAAREVRFVQDESYRKRCRREPGACQRDLVRRAAQLFASSLDRCGGDEGAALGMYNTGRCAGNVKYSRLVLEERARMRLSVGLDAPPAPGAQRAKAGGRAKAEATPSRG